MKFLEDSLAFVPPAPALAIPGVGASVSSDGVTYKLWAPDHTGISVRVFSDRGERRVSMRRDGEGYFMGVDESGKAGDTYLYSTSQGDFPDPASRFQPQGPTGRSQVIDSRQYQWSSTTWSRPVFKGRVIYELHVGTFTPEGTFRAAAGKLAYLAGLGINTMEIMPIAAFPGRRNWGYDGAFPFAPSENYGTPDDFRFLIDAAHAHGISVVLDVVYNHLGSENVLSKFAREYFHHEKKNIWGHALNFEVEPVREYFLQNVRMWLDEYQLDGLRLDAIHAIEDNSALHIVSEMAMEARSRGAFVIAEDERNEVKVLSPVDEGGWSVDGVWADDFHHTVRVALTGRREAHFGSFTGAIDEWVRTIRHGWLYEGQYSPHAGKPRGTPATQRPTEQFVVCISNHDQVGNRPLGERLNASIDLEAYRALSMLLCFIPYTPMLFMGQEWGASTPFLFFTDFPGEIGAGMAAKRHREFKHYGANYDEETLSKMPDPQRSETFRLSQLNWTEIEHGSGGKMLALYRRCLELRRRHAIFQNPRRDQWEVGILAEDILGIRWKDDGGDWLLAITVKAGPREFAGGMAGTSSQVRWEKIFSSRDGVLESKHTLGLAGPEAALFRTTFV